MLVGEVFARMGLDDKEYKRRLAGLEGYTEKKALTLGSIFKGAFSFGIGIGLVQGFRSIGGAITDFVNTAARTEVLDIAMQSVAKSSGYAIAALREQRKSVMELGIAEQEATQILTRFMQAQLDTADAAKLARVAQDAAVIAGYNSSQAAEQMTEAIAKQRPELLSAFGMTRNMNEIYKDYAVTIGKTAAQLSEAEKKQAMLNYILAEGEKIAGTYEASMGVVGKQISSLPRYWDTLKNAIAKPLALPAIGVIVDGITNSLKNAIAWAEANQATLQRWGQTAANVAGFIIRAFQNVSRVFTENWAIIKTVSIAILTYAVATKTAAAAVSIYAIAVKLLNSQLVINTGLLSFIQNVIVYYKVQMMGAAATTNIFTGALMRLRAALYAVHVALGPVGWVILAITGLVTGGMALWNKYTQSLQKAAKTAAPADLAKGFRGLEKSAKGSADATEEQADALNKAGKAAGKNIQSFDEVHQLQEDMAGSAEDLAKSMGLDDTELGFPDVGGFEIPDIGAQLEEMKPTLKGFWEWIKEQAGNLWEVVKQKWQDLKNLAGTVWAGIADVASTAWNGVVNVTQTIWQEIWNLLQAYWSNTAQLATDVFGAIWGYIKGTWDNIKTAVSDIWGAIWGFLSNQWNAIKELGSSIFGALRDLILGKIDLRTAVSKIWEAIKTFFADTWTNIKNLGIEIWTAIGNFFKDQLELTKQLVNTIWTAIKDFFVRNWEATKEAASNIWNAIKTFFGDTWEAIKTAAANIWTAILDFLGINWEETKKRASEIWSNIKTIITDKWNELKNAVGPTWNGIKTAIADKWREIKDDAFNWGKNLIKSFADGVKSAVGSIGSALSGVGNRIKDYLGFSSPTKAGPGRDADQWAPNLIKMFAAGISGGAPEIRSAVSKVAGQLAGLAGGGLAMRSVAMGSVAMPTAMPMASVAASLPGVSRAGGGPGGGFVGAGSDIASAIYEAAYRAIRDAQAGTTTLDGPLQINLYYDKTALGKATIKSLRELQRQGGGVVIPV